MAEEAEVVISLSGLKERIIIYGFALLIGGATALDLFTPFGRSDPFTGTQGQELDDRVTYVELVIEQLLANDIECKKRMDTHLEFSKNKVNQLDVTLERHKIKLEECLKRTGVLK